jgi:hypothetical protein
MLLSAALIADNVKKISFNAEKENIKNPIHFPATFYLSTI